MGKGDSESTTSAATTNQDNRIANDSGIVVSQGGVYTNQLPPEAVGIFNKILDFSSEVVSKAGTIVDNAVMGAQTTANKTVDSQSAVAQNAQLGNASFFTTNAPWLIIAGVAIVFIMRKK